MSERQFASSKMGESSADGYQACFVHAARRTEKAAGLVMVNLTEISIGGTARRWAGVIRAFICRRSITLSGAAMAEESPVRRRVKRAREFPALNCGVD